MPLETTIYYIDVAEKEMKEKVREGHIWITLTI